MRKTIKYIMAAVLAACLFCLSAIPAFACTEGYSGYEITDGALDITEYFGREESAAVPDMITGKPASIIGENVFPEGCGVKPVNLPDTIMKVHSNSFADSITVICESDIAAAAAAAASASDSKPAAAEGENTETEDNAPAAENNPEVSTPKVSDNNLLLSVIIYAAASIVVVAVVIIIFIKRKK